MVMNKFIGIDFGAKKAGTTAIAKFDSNKIITEISNKNEDADKFIRTIIKKLEPEFIFIDAPLSLPNAYYGKGSNYFYRKSDIDAGAMSPMFIGGLTARAIKLKDDFNNIQFIESYPKLIAKEILGEAYKNNLLESKKLVEKIIDKSLEKEIEGINNSKKDDNNQHVLSIIKKHLTIIRKNINADRVWIAKFHNGHDNETYTNRSDQLFSIIEESLNYGISSQKKFFYNIPVVFYNFILEKVKNEDYSYIENVKELDPSLNLVLKLQGIKSTGAVGLRNESGELKAIIGYDYIKESKPLNERNISYIKENSEIFIEYMQLYNLNIINNKLKCEEKYYGQNRSIKK